MPGTCLVIGGAGFVGAHVVKALRDRGWMAVVYDAVPDPASLRAVLGEEAQSVELVRGDVTQLHHVLHTVQHYGITDVVHLAAFLTGVCASNPPLAIRLNVGGMVNVLETCRIASLRRLVWASSGAVFGSGYPEEVLIGNDFPHTPLGVYGATKSFGESLAAHYFKTWKVDSVGLRFGFMSGPGMQRGVTRTLVSELIEKPAVGEVSRVPWADDTVNWLWVGDAARAVVLALEGSTTATRAFSLNGDYRSIRDVAAYVQRLFPDSLMELEPGRFGFAHLLDASPIERELGFRSEWNVEDQVLYLANAARRHRGMELISAPGGAAS